VGCVVTFDKMPTPRFARGALTTALFFVSALAQTYNVKFDADCTGSYSGLGSAYNCVPGHALECCFDVQRQCVALCSYTCATCPLSGSGPTNCTLDPPNLWPPQNVCLSAGGFSAPGRYGCASGPYCASNYTGNLTVVASSLGGAGPSSPPPTGGNAPPSPPPSPVTATGTYTVTSYASSNGACSGKPISTTGTYGVCDSATGSTIVIKTGSMLTGYTCGTNCATCQADNTKCPTACSVTASVDPSPLAAAVITEGQCISRGPPYSDQIYTQGPSSPGGSATRTTSLLLLGLAMFM
jgi:hypothetical protein